jgi:hypothetical protein
MAPSSPRTTITKPVANEQVPLAVVVLVRADVKRCELMKAPTFETNAAITH